ncbi:hypothetical protein Krad_2673 [Kineococcus radiotolerans SRS30216 = ATCC BAA-149]|uniref:Uncharacterized protein n=1 Tax=Kineococcus radiotolerans (strain ATCC BAA-149 / DSM 14245 / SRS30216) TaxID=266940 RepID=A6WBF6_KINRD|nr:hypothetical protein Krad_2673 [Kineococcus radiotolerans SRS30216 = ATCC BAA-149]
MPAAGTDARPQHLPGPAPQPARSAHPRRKDVTLNTDSSADARAVRCDASSVALHRRPAVSTRAQHPPRRSRFDLQSSRSSPNRSAVIVSASSRQ